MKVIKLCAFGLITLVMAGCVQSSSSTSYQRIEARKPFNVTSSEKRINTVECLDNDDWYLDGYRVGKSFREHKQKLLSQRKAYCEEQTKQPVPNRFLISWENAYKRGSKA